MCVGGAARRAHKTVSSFYVAISSSNLSLTDCSVEYKKLLTEWMSREQRNLALFLRFATSWQNWAVQLLGILIWSAD